MMKILTAKEAKAYQKLSKLQELSPIFDLIKESSLSNKSSLYVDMEQQEGECVLVSLYTEELNDLGYKVVYHVDAHVLTGYEIRW